MTHSETQRTSRPVLLSEGKRSSAWERESRLPAKAYVELMEFARHAAAAEFDRRGVGVVYDWLLAATSRQSTATRRAEAVLDDLKGQGLIESSAYDHAMTLIDVLFTPNTVYATIAPDDGGVSFYWRAADMSIEIDICPVGGFWWRVRNVAAENYSGSGTSIHQFDQLKHSLKMFSKEVELANPHWRQQTI